MGKAAATAAEMKRKKKGRPSLSSSTHQKSLTPPPNSVNFNSSRRSTRRNPNPDNSPSPPPDFVDGDDDDDDERKEKKVKLVVRLPQSNQHFHQNSANSASASASDSDEEPHPKKRNINNSDHRSDDDVTDQEEKVLKATDTQHGSPLESGPTTPLPDKKLLVFILDRLQKKDTYGVFSEPVDPNELPDYLEIIEHPMDFGTVRKKLDAGVYPSLEALEADVFLICANAMQYNAPDTVYFRQARSIQELAKRDFANLRHEGEDGEPQPKVVRRGRPPSKNLKKSNELLSPADRIDPDPSPGATLASAEEKATASNSYNLRKPPISYRYRSSDAFVTPSRNGEHYSEWLADWNDEFPASILRADMKYGKKHFAVDENRRDTYKQFNPKAFSNKLTMLGGTGGDTRRLMTVGLHLEQHAYARSLARFASNLGPVAWGIAKRKIESALPVGVKFGPGWVGESESPARPSALTAERRRSSNTLPVASQTAHPVASQTGTPPSGVDSAIASKTSQEIGGAVNRLHRQNEFAVQGGGFSWATPASPAQMQQKAILRPTSNGLNGVLAFDLSSQIGMTKSGTPSGHGQGESSAPRQMFGAKSQGHTLEENKFVGSWGTVNSGNPFGQGRVPGLYVESEARLPGKSWQIQAGQHRQSLPTPPDLNVKVQQPGSPATSSQISSPQQPDLALQL